MQVITHMGYVFSIFVFLMHPLKDLGDYSICSDGSDQSIKVINFQKMNCNKQVEY